jgi:hypothetical protein
VQPNIERNIILHFTSDYITIQKVEEHLLKPLSMLQSLGEQYNVKVSETQKRLLDKNIHSTINNPCNKFCI